MGQKVNPHGLRVGVIKDWDSRWFARDNAFGDILVEDYKLRKFLKKKLYGHSQDTLIFAKQKIPGKILKK